MNSKKFWTLFALMVAGPFILAACELCPPAGPWPQPPWCGSGGSLQGVGTRDDNGCFPPSCDMIPDEAARIQCKEFKAGLDIWDWPQDCSLLPTNACSELCETEKLRYITTGHENWIAGIRDNKDWWLEPYTKVYTFGTVNERLEIFQPDAHPMAGAPDEEDLLQREVGYSHYYNMPHGGGSWFDSIQAVDPDFHIHAQANKEEQVPPELKPAMRRNLEGEIVREPYRPGIDIPGRTGDFHFNSFYPEFIAHVVEEWKHNVDLEADSVGVDNLKGILYAADLATYFDDYTVQEFGKYLKENLTPQDWERLGASADTFNYADYLRSKGFTSASFLVQDESWRQIPLVLEFRAFVAERNADAFCTMSDQIHAYAEEQGRYVAVWGNMGGENSTVPQEACVDFIYSEFAYIGLAQPYAYHTVVPWAKFANAKGKPMLNVRHLSDAVALNEFTLNDPSQYVNVYRLGTMESYAARSSQIHLRGDEGHLGTYINDKLTSYKMTHDTSRLEQIKVAYDFMRRYKSYFADFNTTNSQVALIFDNQLAYQFMLDDPDNDAYYQDDRELGTELYRLGLDYDVIAPTVAFDKYALIFLPRSPSVPETDAQRLLEFVEAGGTLVILNQPALGGELLTPGTHGKGEIVQFNRDDPADWAAMVSFIYEATGAIQSDSTPPLSAISYTDGNGNYVVHLFTSHTDLATDFPTLENIHLTLPFSIEGLNVSYASLENPDFIPLDADNIVIPSLTTYGLLIIEKP